MAGDKLGCYRVGPHKVYSKLDAIVLSQQTGQHLTWEFNDQAYGDYDWLTEPQSGILSL